MGIIVKKQQMGISVEIHRVSFSTSTVSGSNWNLEMSVFMEGVKLEDLEKNPRGNDENQQQIHPT